MHKLFLAAAILFAGSAYAADAERHYLGISFLQGETVYFDLKASEAKYEAKIEGTTLKITPLHTTDGADYSYEIANINRIFNTTQDVGGSTSIMDIATDGSVITPLGADRFAVSNAEGLSVYAVDGRRVPASVSIDGAGATVDLSVLNPGVYVIKFGGHSLKVTKQ